VSHQEPFAELYKSGPVLVIREQLRYCASVAKLAAVAREKGFDVQYITGALINDAIIRESQSERAHSKNHTIRSASRFIENYS
jgi:hypothetical protein